MSIGRPVVTDRQGVVVDLAIAEAVAEGIDEMVWVRMMLVGLTSLWWGYGGDRHFALLLSAVRTWPMMVRVAMPSLVDAEWWERPVYDDADPRYDR